jgi:hypothetical protein
MSTTRVIGVLLLLSTAAFGQTHKLDNANYRSKAGLLEIEADSPFKTVPEVIIHDVNQNVVPHPTPVFAFGGTKTVQIQFATTPFPKALADIVLPSVTFADNSNQTNMTITVTTDAKRIIGIMQKVAQTQSESNIFASGLVTTASTGTAGAGDINLNSPNILGGVTNPGLLSGFLQIKRATTAAGDPKNFEAGVKYQAGFGLGDKTAKTITAVLLDLAAKAEGTASQFGVNNIVGDSSVSLQSPVFGRTKNFSAKFRIVSGIEGGSNRSKGDAPTDLKGFGPLKNIDWIARGKFGFEGALQFTKDDQHPQVPFDSIALNVGAVDRYLVFDELRYNMTTNAVDTTTRGNRPWIQVDGKLMLGHTDSASFGLKVTYQRGSLPPVFAAVKTFQFGFVYETKDRTAKN